MLIQHSQPALKIVRLGLLPTKTEYVRAAKILQEPFGLMLMVMGVLFIEMLSSANMGHMDLVGIWLLMEIFLFLQLMGLMHQKHAVAVVGAQSQKVSAQIYLGVIGKTLLDKAARYTQTWICAIQMEALGQAGLDT